MWSNIFVSFFDLMARRVGYAPSGALGIDAQTNYKTATLITDAGANLVTDSGDKIIFYE